MDPKPPDRSTSPTLPAPPRNPPPPRLTNASNQSPLHPHMDLVRSPEALQLSSRAAQSSSHQDEEQVTTQYNLLLKVPDPQGTARAIPIHVVRLELQQIAWGDSYKAVNEVLTNLFLATFANPVSMIFVVKRQPWIVRRHNLLIEIVDPQKNIPDGYRFQYMYVTAGNWRPSDLDQLSYSSILRDELFEAATAKINVTRKATDKVFVPISDTRTIIVFVHYTKIQTICNYCAGFFHNADDCHARNSTVLAPPNLSGEQRPTLFQLHDAWMTQLSDIPMDFVTRQITSVASDGAQLSTLLSKLRSTFAAPSSALGPGPSASQRLIQPDPPQQQLCNHSPVVTMVVAPPPELQEGTEAPNDDNKMEDRNAQPDQVADTGKVKQTALQLDYSRKEESTFWTRWRRFSAMALSNLMSGGWVWVLVSSTCSPSTRPTLQFKFKVAMMVELGLQLAMILLSVLPTTQAPAPASHGTVEAQVGAFAVPR
ncbi:uncharacterized protein [Miscanthus floridulus]|uniref:uncharacterized protein n=1 Tax=Miscanthus floridulus TaxID=154761 RepID=UPI003457DD66